MSDPFLPENGEGAEAFAARLQSLRGAAPSEAFMARLRAAEPVKPAHAQEKERPAPSRATGSRRHWLHGIAWGAAAAVVLFAGISASSTWKNHRFPGAKTPGGTLVAAPLAPADPSSGNKPDNSRIFLPVESATRLVSLREPPRLIQRPDEPPLRVQRAVLVDDLTAVGADTDAALRVQRSREVYIPVSSPVY